MSAAISPTDGLPWPVVLLLALVTLAVLYGISLLAARFRKPATSPGAASPVPQTAPYRGAVVTLGSGDEDGETQ